MICIYLYNGDIHRFKLTDNILKHYLNIKNKFKDIADFNFTIIGSEKELSKKLVLKYFNEDEYNEFDQNNEIYGKYSIGYNNNFLNMLSDKIRTGINLASKKNPDILFWAGSNDYISFDFFEQILNYYNPNKKQIFGIDKYNNGFNSILYCFYDGNKNILNIDDTNTSFWWSGNQQKEREKYFYTGGIIGINSKLYLEHKDILDVWNYDEGFIEKYILDKKDIDKFNSKNIFWCNIKTVSNNEITSYKRLKEYFLKNNSIINFLDIPSSTKISIELEYLKKIFS